MRLASTEPPGVILVGEGEFSYKLGSKLREHEIPVMTFNLFSSSSTRARNLDFEVFEGNLLSSNDRIYADLTRYHQCLLMTQSFVFNSLAFNELVPEFGLNQVNMIPVSFRNEKMKSNVSGPIRNHILFDSNLSAKWYNQFIKEHDIHEIEVEHIPELGENDMILYHINDDKEVTFRNKRNQFEDSDEGVIGYLKDAYLYEDKED